MKSIILLRFGLIFLGIISIFLKEYFEFYDLFIFFILIFGLVLNYIKREQFLEFETITNYMFWLIFTILVFFIRIGNYFDFYVFFAIILISKILILGFNYFKYKKITITSTVLSKIWILTLFFYLSELTLNSTHGLKNLCFSMGVISSIESFINIIKFKNWKPTRNFFTKNSINQF